MKLHSFIYYGVCQKIVREKTFGERENYGKYIHSHCVDTVTEKVASVESEQWQKDRCITTSKYETLVYGTILFLVHLFLKCYVEDRYSYCVYILHFPASSRSPNQDD